SQTFADSNYNRDRLVIRHLIILRSPVRAGTPSSVCRSKKQCSKAATRLLLQRALHEVQPVAAPKHLIADEESRRAEYASSICCYSLRHRVFLRVPGSTGASLLIRLGSK